MVVVMAAKTVERMKMEVFMVDVGRKCEVLGSDANVA
jgi:hypothetical protein